MVANTGGGKTGKQELNERCGLYQLVAVCAAATPCVKLMQLTSWLNFDSAVAL